VIPLIYLFCIVLDSVDGEIAGTRTWSTRSAGSSRRVCHRATEFSLLMAYAAAAPTCSTESPLAVAVALLLMTGDGMHIYVYERGSLALRNQMGFKGHVRFSADRVYKRGTRLAR
jgi:hypothetical protein